MKITEKIKEKYSLEVMLLTLVSFLAGLAVGFLISPAKNGITFGSYNGCNNKITDSNKVNKSVKKCNCGCCDDEGE